MKNLHKHFTPLLSQFFLFLFLSATPSAYSQTKDSTATKPDSTAIHKNIDMDFDTDFDFDFDADFDFDFSFKDFKPWSKHTQKLVMSQDLPRFSSFPGDNESYSPFRYNRVDGFFLGLGSDKRKSFRFDRSYFTNFGVGYAFASHYWQVFGGLDKRFGSSADGTVLGFEGHILTDTKDAWKISQGENTTHALIAREDYRNYFRRSGWSAHLEQFLSQKFRISAEFRQDLYEPLSRNAEWSVFGGRKVFRENPDFEKGTVNSGIFSINYRNVTPIFLRNDGFRAHASVEIGRKDYQFERYLAEIAYYQPIDMLTFNTRIRLASTVGTAPAPLYFSLGGVGTLPGYSWNEFSGNRMALWSSELFIHVFPPLWYMPLAGFGVILFTDIGSVGIAEKNENFTKNLLPSMINDYKMSVGVALGNSNDSFRIGASWRTDRAESPNIVVRFSQVF